MPLILMCIFVCIFYALLLHDKGLLNDAARQGGMRAAMYIWECQDIEKEAVDYDYLEDRSLIFRFNGHREECDRAAEWCRRYVQGRLLLCSEPQFEMKSAYGGVTVTYSAGLKYAAQGLDSVGGEVLVKVFEEEEFIRLARGIIEDELHSD